MGAARLKFQMAAVSMVGLVAALGHSAPVFAGGFDSGFEDGDLDGWTVVSTADPIVVVGPEGPGQFPVYGDIGHAGVEPYRGDFMLRLGTPKQKDQTQTRGVNAISQQFVAESTIIALPMRLFSLDHRGDDFLHVSLNGPSGEVASDNAFEFGNARGDVCRAPCNVTIDVGKQKDVIATGWQELRFTGLQVGATYTLTVELRAGQNESLASWLYIDGGNTPPSAVINFSLSNAVEGDFVVFDCLASEDSENSDLSCIWSVSFPGVSPAPIIGTTVVYWFPNQGTGTVNVEVTDGEMSTETSTSLSIGNQAPLVNALDVEVLAGGSVELVCRFADPGAADSHLVDFSVVDGETGEVQVVEENVPALASGVARTTYQAPAIAGETSGSCSVTDDSGSEGSDDFTISVLTPEQLASRVAANTGSTEGTPQVLHTDKSSLGGLAGPQNVAVYEILLPGNKALPVGTEISVTAQFPVDYDIVLLNGTADGTINAAPWVSAPFVSAPFVSAPFVSVPFVSAPFVSAPFVSAPFVSAPFVSAPFVSAPFVSAPFVSAPFVSAPFVSAPLTQSLWLDPGFLFENFPLSQLAGAPDGSNIAGIDVSFQDLGAQNSGSLIDESVFVKGLSAEFGANTEHLLVEVGPGEKGLYLAVIPQAGSFSAAPFNLEVEAAVPPATTALLGPACNGSPLVATPTGSIEVLRSYGDKTLIVTQKQRMMITFGMDDAAWQAWMLAMDDFFSHEKVMATVISVPSSWYDSADTNPCLVQEQNAVAALIKDAIESYRSDNTQYVQIMGSLDIVMPYYLQDETQTGNEALFASDLLARPGTPLAVAISEGYMLTDAYYVDSDPQPFNGRMLYLEDISVSRMVETPDEILANAQRFVASGGVINLLSVEAGTPGAGTQSTGYDFFIDGTEVINAILDSAYPGSNTTLNNDTWDAEQLRCQFFGAGENCTKPVSAVNAVNAHMSYNAGLTAKGFNCAYLPPEKRPPGLSCATDDSDPLGEVFLSGESAGIYDDPDADGPAIVINGATFSIGCHSGLSVPDAWGLSALLGLPLDPAQDWVQELGTWVGSYNFAYGDTEVADRGTEGIMPLVLARFAEGMPLGEALTRAKWQYGAGLFEFGVYDEKSLVGLNLFGMPQATLEGAVGSGAFATLGAEVSSLATGDDLVVNYTEEDSASQVTGSIGMRSNAKGVWYTIDHLAQGILGRPLLPVIKPFELRPIDETSVHAVALRGGAYTTYLNEDPVFPVQSHDLITSIGEPQPCVETLAPSLIASVNSFDSPGGLLQTFIVQPGQFECTNAIEQGSENYTVRGDFRIWNGMDLELLHPATVELDGDRKPPVVIRQDLLGNPETGIVTATLDARDDSGIREIIALVYRDDDGFPGGTGTATPYSVTERNEDGVFELILPDAFDNLLSFQYLDEAGNITAKTLKGALLRAIEVSIAAEISLDANGGNARIFVTIGDFCSLEAPYLILDYGDDSEPQVIELDDPEPPCAPGDNGSRTFEFPYSYDASDLTGSITIRAEVRSAGGVGSDEITISPCTDPEGDVSIPNADIVACGISAEGSKLIIDVRDAGIIANDIQYRLILPQTNTQIKYAAGKVTGPSKIKPTGVATENSIRFTFNASKLGWNGSSPFEFLFETQDGVSGGQGQGFVDTTDVKVYQPPPQ